MNLSFFLILVFVICSIVISVLDIMTFHISLLFNYGGFMACILFSIFTCYKWGDCTVFYIRLVGAIGQMLLFILIRFISKNGLGWGDIHYSLFCGFICGIPGFILSSLFASITGIIAFIILKLVTQNRNQVVKRIPFAPFMFAGCIIDIIFELIIPIQFF